MSLNTLSPPLLVAPPQIVAALEALCSGPDALKSVEQLISAGNLGSLPLIASSNWQSFSSQVCQAFTARDHVIVKGLPIKGDGATLLMVSLTLGSKFRTYRDKQIVKHFKMSPWTTDLSHTTREGEFHTDLNTETQPPAITAMQCLESDPGAPRYGVSRVARLTDLLAFLTECDDQGALRFLTQVPVTMLNDRAQSSWSGYVVDQGSIRYHPETLRAAVRRVGLANPALDRYISGVARAAFAVSHPFALDQGDVLFLSNRRTLHYRGECSVVFTRYPTEFNSRRISILHMPQDPTAS